VRSCLLVFLIACHAGSVATQARAPFDDDHVEAINGTRLHFRVRGVDRSHPYLLILHGGPGGSALEFYPWGALLEREVNVVYLDQRGCGLSQRAQLPADTASFSFANLVRDVEGVREKLGIARWYVLGHSFGGMYGVEYVVTHPEHVLGYIHMAGLVSVPMIDEDWLDYAERAVRATRERDPSDGPRVDEVLANVAALRAMPQEQRDRELGTRIVDKLLPEMIHDRFPAANDYDARLDIEVLQRYHVAPEVLHVKEPGAALAEVEHLATRDILGELPRVRVPTLILSGAQDPIVPPKRSQLAHERIAGSQLVLVDQAAHELYKDQPTKTASAVLAFIGERHAGSSR
jgi:proline iminopeptidase